MRQSKLGRALREPMMIIDVPESSRCCMPVVPLGTSEQVWEAAVWQWTVQDTHAR